MKALHQLRLPMPRPGDPIATARTMLAAQGWVPDARDPKETRWWLPATDWYVRVNWHVAAFYRLQGREMPESRHIPTSDTLTLAVMIEEIALRTRRTHAAHGRKAVSV